MKPIIVIKIGTSVLNSFISSNIILESFLDDINDINKTNDVVIVSSGAISFGIKTLNSKYTTRDFIKNNINMRCYASIGQAKLINFWTENFIKYDKIVSQVLITERDFLDKLQRDSIINMTNKILDKGIIPIFNENDAITTRNIGYRDDENKILWDNDNLASLLSKSISASRLILLSDIDGVYDEHNKVVPIIQDHYENKNVLEKSLCGRGGIQAKINAGLEASKHGSICLYSKRNYKKYY